MTNNAQYRLTKGSHWGPDPERPGKRREMIAGEVIELSEFAAKAIADKIEPVNAAAQRKANAAAVAAVAEATVEDPSSEDVGAEVNATDGAIELADAENVDLAELEGTGKGGRITKADVETFLEED